MPMKPTNMLSPA